MNAVQRPRLSIVVLNRQRERFVAHAIECRLPRSAYKPCVVLW